jgi:hypothetical protein
MLPSVSHTNAAAGVVAATMDAETAAVRRGEMRAILFLLLILAAIVFASFYGSALRPYWEERLPRVVSLVGEGEFREAASAMVDEDAEERPPPSMVVTPSTDEPAEPDTCESPPPVSYHRQ